MVTKIFIPVLIIIIVVIFYSFQESSGSAGRDNPMFYSGTPRNPMIQAMVDSVSADSITSYLQRLVGFYTRHTVSDTTSLDTGIGAARRWIKSKYQQWRNASGGPLQPSFFWFTETICGIPGLHANVMATLPGIMPQAQNRFFIVSGHMDGRTFGRCDATSFAPSANDDGSGTASSIEAARVMSAFSFDASLIFMTVTGEDEGLFGSTAYANWAAANNMRIDGMLTNDVIGNIVAPDSTIDSTSVRHFSVGPSTSPSRQMARYFKLKGEQYVPSMTVNLIPAQDRPGRGGDHIPFNDNGYAAVRFTEPAERLDYQHSNLDLIEHMSPSYTAQITRLTVAGFASMALAPQTPQAPLSVQDVGSGNDLLLSWTPTNTEPDFAGYRIAWRHQDSLFYQGIVLAGNVTQFQLTGLPTDQPVYLSYSALDSDGNESIFSAEVLATPRSVPAAPQDFEATSTMTGIKFKWRKNTELDLAGYTISRTAPGTAPVDFPVDATDSTYVDNSVQAHILYRFTIRARDMDGNLSLPSVEVKGQLPTHDMGILVVDATKDGTGNNPLQPTDEQVDQYYQAILQNFNITASWDIADSMAQQSAISDADMGVYSTVVWHSDVRQPDHLIAADSTAIKKYLDNGGKLLLGGWAVIASASGIPHNGPLPIPAGSFVNTYLQIDTSNAHGLPADFDGADAVWPGFSDVNVDSLKVPANFNHNLFFMEAIQALVPGSSTDVLYTYRSASQPPSLLHGLPNAFKHLGGGKDFLLLDFPLYFVLQPQAQQTITQALIELGETPLSVPGNEEDPTEITRFELQQNYPNPFNPGTLIRYHVPSHARSRGVLVTLRIYDPLGRKIATLVDEIKTPGAYSVKWDGKNSSGQQVASGIYLYRLQAGDNVQIRKMLLLR